MSSTIPNEQPIPKRQRIDSVGIKPDDGNKSVQRAFASISNGSDKQHKSNATAPPDILPTTSYSSPIPSTNKIDAFGNSSALVSHQSATDADDEDVLDNASSAIERLECIADSSSNNGFHTVNSRFPDLVRTSHLPPNATSVPGLAGASPKQNHNAPCTVSTTLSSSSSHASSSPPSSSSTTPSSSSSSSPTSRNVPSYSANSTSSDSADHLDAIQTHLMKQCLCNISNETLHHAFERFRDIQYHMNELPPDQLIQFLSSLQLLFDVYLKQNAKGQICTRIMQTCEELIVSEQNIIGDILNLHEYQNKFVQFLAGRIVASCMVIAKDNKDKYEGWLSDLLSHFVIKDYDLQKIVYSLEIILRILEWRDFEEHPLEDMITPNGQATENGESPSASSNPLPLVVPPIENNYFAMHYNAEFAASTTNDGVGAPMVSTQFNHFSNQSTAPVTTHRPVNSSEPLTCQLQMLSDSESFDTTDLKCNVVCALKIKWSPLVNIMSKCINELCTNRNKRFAENVILTFLTLWERIISVQANLSVDSTLPFHDKLTVIKGILIAGNLPVSIYKQILSLLNESLCYGTTLALQSVLPDETSQLANHIFNSVKSQRIFNSLPVQLPEPENDIGFIGYRNPTIHYSLRASYRQQIEHNRQDCNTYLTDEQSLLGEEHRKSTDYILMQKLVLLILKAIAVTVKPVRGDDSSDSSMDGSNSNSSTDYDTYQATVQIERATRDVLKKLIQFIKNKLNHHPETHFSKMIAHLFSDQDDYLIEAMVCVLDITTAFLPRNSLNSSISNSQFRVLIDMLNPVYSFLELLELISYNIDLLLDYLCSNETCFLLYLLRFLKYIRYDWNNFVSQCNDRHPSALDKAMSTLIRLRMRIDRLVMQSLFPYDIKPITELLRQCEEAQWFDEVGDG